MRYIIIGAGSIGGTIGGRLFQAGRDVLMVARGAHRDAIEKDGLRLRSPDADAVLRVAVASDPTSLALHPGDAVIMAVKAQDTSSVLDGLVGATSPGTPIVCVQNGVENERVALRGFPRVYGAYVHCRAEHLTPGVVNVYTDPIAGVIDVGRYPTGCDDMAREVAKDLRQAGFDSRAIDDVMRWKYAKLLGNLANTMMAFTGSHDEAAEISRRARSEALACYEAAGIVCATPEEEAERLREMPPPRPVAGTRRIGSSSLQSLARGTGQIETDYLNGEIVLMGRLHGVPTPVNDALQQLSIRMARAHLPPGSLSIRALQDRIQAAGT